MARITKRLVDGLKADPARELYVPDDATPGFGVRIRPSGMTTYVLRYRAPTGESRRLTIGRTSVLSPEEARRIAQKHLAAVAGGGDPARQKRELRRPAGREEGEVRHGVDEFRRFKIFEALEDEDFQAIASLARVREFEVAERLTVEGAPADNLYLFVEGGAAVKVRGADGRQVLVDELGPEQVLGHAVIAEPHVYTASAWTNKPSRVIVIDGRRLRSLCQTNERIGHQLAKGIGEVVAERFGRVEAAKNGRVIPGRAIDELQQFRIFSELDVVDLDAIARIAYLREFAAGEELTREGAEADRLYLFLRGRAEVTMLRPDGRAALIDELGPGDVLGWGAIVEPHFYAASVRTLEPSELIVLDANDLRELLEADKRIGYQVAKGVGEVIAKRFGSALGRPGKRVSPTEGVEGLRQFRIFEGLEDADLAEVGLIARARSVEPGEELTREGARADELYCFLRGRAAIRVRDPQGRQVLIDEVGPGEVLGWGAVTEPYLYTASSWATEPAEVVVINGRSLRDLCRANKRIGYQVAKGIGEVISRRFGRAVAGRSGRALGGHGLDELRRFKVFARLDLGDLEAVARIAYVRDFPADVELITEGAPAEQLYLFLKGRAMVVVQAPDGGQTQIDELGPGQVLGWGAVMEPHVYTASARTTEPAELVIIKGKDLRELCESNKQLGYAVVRGMGEVMSARFGHVVRGRGTDELHRFKIFQDLDFAELDAVARISTVRRFEKDDALTTEGAPADQMYLFLNGKADVKVRDPDGRPVLIDEVGPGDMLGWSTAVEPYIYTASAWATEPCEAIVVDGEALRELCVANKNLGYQVTKGIGEVISRRFGRAKGRQDDLRAKDVRAFAGPERVVWENGALQLTTQAVLIGMGTDSPEVIPLEALLDVDVDDRRVVFRLHGGDVVSPPLEEPEKLAALAQDEMRRTRYARRRKDYYAG